MSRSEDANFNFVFTWITGGSDKGWVTHFRPKHPPFSGEMVAVFELLGLNQFSQCPEFDFDSCYWSFRPFTDDIFAGNRAHETFGVLNQHFSLAVEQLLRAHSLLLPFGMKLLNITPTPESPIVERPLAGSPSVKQGFPAVFDVAISFAGSNRPEAEQLARIVREAGFVVFYDNFYPEHLWGKDLTVFFDEIFRKRSRFCVMFVSQDYAYRLWTTHERRSAQARAVAEKGSEYILPIKIDETELPGLLPTTGYVSLAEHGIEQIGKMLVAKLDVS
jgi:hypothetical protein